MPTDLPARKERRLDIYGPGMIAAGLALCLACFVLGLAVSRPPGQGLYMISLALVAVGGLVALGSYRFTTVYYDHDGSPM